MQILLLTNEYPPNVYGGAGVHVDHLSKALVRLEAYRSHHLEVVCFAERQVAGQSPPVTPVPGAPAELFLNLQFPKFLDTLYRNVLMVGQDLKPDLIHCHTWYTYLAGCLLKQITGAPLLITVHSLEPHRPWKKEQLGNAYHATSWLEQTALHNADGIVAVSTAMKHDIIDLYGIDPQRIRVIYNGVDTQRYRRIDRPEVLKSYGIDPTKPYVLFVGRITRQKGIIHLVNALPLLDKGVQAVLCAGAPDTEAIAKEMDDTVRQARSGTENEIIWISKIVPVDDAVALYSHADLFVCPSVYEPFGIINLEAMACGTPVVAAAVGGIPEVVIHDETGILVPFEAADAGDPEPRQPQRYAQHLAQAINALLQSAQRREEMRIASRKRVEAHFGWDRIAEKTLHYYMELAGEPA